MPSARGSHRRADPLDASPAPQGHVGAVYFTGKLNGEQVTRKPMVQRGGPRGPFHTDLGKAYKGGSNVVEVVAALRNVMTDWIWDGTGSFPHNIHPFCEDKDGNSVTSARQQTSFATVVTKFDKWDK